MLGLSWSGELHNVGWTHNSESAAVENVGIDHGGADMSVNEQFLDDANVIAAFEELSGETVPKCVGGSMFRDSRRPDGFLYDFLNDRLIDVVAALQACFSVESSRSL